MKSKVQKWGNSLGLRIPKVLAEETNLGEGSSVDIRVDGSVLIIKSSKKYYSLSKLLSQITSKNLHSEIDFGQPKGKEVW